MQKITPHLWYDKEAKEAAEFYTATFPDSKIISSSALHNTPSGDVDLLTIELCGQRFMMISAGPLFKFNPSISFLVNCETKEEVDLLWGKLSLGGKALMELGQYPFSKKYGWIQDKYGLSWQIMFTGGAPIKQKIIPVIMFVGKNYGKAEEAMHFYTSVFHNSKIGEIFRYGKGNEPDAENAIAHGQFTLEGQEFALMESAREHHFSLNEAISCIVHCDNQKEIDEYWKKLSHDPKAEQCGWLKDKYGVSWQIVPGIMNEMMATKDAEKLERVTQAFLKMKKFDIEKLQQAFEGK